jgi:hypothetical protein
MANSAFTGVGTSLSNTYQVGGTDVALADGGTGASLSAPGSDSIFFYDVGANSTAWLTPSAPVTIDGTLIGVAVATAADQETGTSAVTVVTPSQQHRHASAAKFWVNATGNSTTIVASYNMTSWADTAPGQATGTIATDFSSADWCGQVSVLDGTSAWDATYTVGCGFGTMAAGTFRVDCSSMQDGGTAAAAFNDPGSWHVVGFGDQ